MNAHPVWLFMAATAMATTVSTLAATAMVEADSAEPVAVTCTCDAPATAPALAPAVAPVLAAEPEQTVEPEPEQTAAPEQAAEPKPAASPLHATVEGNLDKAVIRRVVRAHIGEVRACYNEGLARDPELAGRVVIGFTIGTDGKVDRTEVSSSDLPNDEVADCIAGAIARWRFPKATDGESVHVSYPFVLEPG